MAAFGTVVVRAGIGGSFRQALIDEEWIVAAYPLSETVSTLARDITGRHNTGTYTGTGFTRGVSVDLPEGALGCTFDGNGYVHVADTPIAEGSRNLSMPNGSINVLVLIKTTTNDATLRCLAQKQATDASGNGWHVALQNGAIEFALKIGGVSEFSFQRGAVSDGDWHLVHCHYNPTTPTATILIDGVLSGSAVTPAGNDPEHVATPFRIGAFADGSGGFIGTLSYVALSRQSTTTFGVTLQATRAWTDITRDVRGEIRWRRGLADSGVSGLVARAGTLSCELDNGRTNSARTVGYYSPGHADVRSGFIIGMPVQLLIEGRAQWRGRLVGADPTPGTYRAPRTKITCEDWMGVAADTPVTAVAAQVSQRSDVVFGEVLDVAAGRVPAAVDLGVGSSVFQFALDAGEGESESMITEFSRVAASERAFVYILGDGTLVYEGRGDRQLATTLDATFDQTMSGLEVRYNLERLVNIVRVRITPRRVDSVDTTVLATLDVGQTPIPIAPGESVVFEGGYVDPSQEAARVGATDLHDPPVANTDYGFWTDAGGTGTDLSGDLALVAALGGNSWRLEFTNNGTRIGYLSRPGSDVGVQIRGRGLYSYQPKVVERRNSDSVRRYGPRTVELDMPYESSAATAASAADFYLSIFGSQRPIPRSVSLHGWSSAALLTQVTTRDIGDRIGLIEPVTAITTDDPESDAVVGYFINEVAGIAKPGVGEIEMTWTLGLSVPTGAGIFDTSAFDEDFAFAF